MDPVDIAIDAIARVGEGLTQRHHGQHAAAGGDVSGRTCRGPGVEHEDIALDRPQPIDLETGRVGCGIAPGGQHHADAGAARAGGGDGRQLTTRGGLEQHDQVALEPGQHDLCLGVAEASVEFQHLNTGRSHHQAGVEAPPVGRASVAQRADDRRQDGIDGTPDIVGAEGWNR